MIFREKDEKESILIRQHDHGFSWRDCEAYKRRFLKMKHI